MNSSLQAVRVRVSRLKFSSQDEYPQTSSDRNSGGTASMREIASREKSEAVHKGYE